MHTSTFSGRLLIVASVLRRDFRFATAYLNELIMSHMVLVALERSTSMAVRAFSFEASGNNRSNLTEAISVDYDTVVVTVRNPLPFFWGPLALKRCQKRF